MGSARPSVSVIVPCFNASSYVSTCIESVLAQEMGDFELVAVDDGSTDHTLDVLKGFCRDSRVRVRRRPSNSGGPAAPRNDGLRQTTAPLVMLLDSDDLLEPQALRSLVEFNRLAPTVGLIFFNSSVVDFDSGKERSGAVLDAYDGFHQLSKRQLGQGVCVVDDPRTYAQLIRTNFVRTSGATMLRTVIDTVGPFDERLTNADDWDMWLRITRGHNLGLIGAPYAVHRRREGSISIAMPGCSRVRFSCSKNSGRLPMTKTHAPC